jgi:hypothetical protein
MRVAEHNRLGATSDNDVRAHIREHVRWLDKSLDTLDREYGIRCAAVRCCARRTICCGVCPRSDQCST